MSSTPEQKSLSSLLDSASTLQKPLVLIFGSDGDVNALVGRPLLFRSTTLLAKTQNGTAAIVDVLEKLNSDKNTESGS